MIMGPNNDGCAVGVVVAKLDYWIANYQHTNENYSKALFEDNAIYAQAEYGIEVYCLHMGLRMAMDSIDTNDIFAVVIEFGTQGVDCGMGQSVCIDDTVSIAA